MLDKKYIGGILVLCLAYYLSNRNCCSKKKEGKIVETKFGSIQGIISESRDGREFYEWLGIPYAKPPVEDLRFATPQPLDKKWDGVRDGSKFGNVCAQLDLFAAKISGEEDCLYLNIHAPKVEDPKKLLPVMFWIHGGYFACGSADVYRPDFLMDEDVIVVSINYRLAALGFLSTGDSIVRGNMGLKDQSLALKWVNENIANFGGDPKQITIFGESAGSASVHFQMLSPMSNGLMQRAIAQSGSALNMWAIYDDPVSQAKSFASKLKCPTETSIEMVECLRKVKINDLLAVHWESTEPTRTKDKIFVPTVEKVIDEETFLPDHPINILNSGNMSKIPWLAGFNADEGLLFTHSLKTNDDFRHSVEEDWNIMSDVVLFLNETEKEFKDKLVQFYLGSEKNLDLLEKIQAVVQLITDRWFGYGMYKSAVAHAKHAPVQFYYYNKIGPSLYDILSLVQGKYPVIVEVLLGMTKNWINSNILRKAPVSHGVCHGDDLAMLFEMTGFFNVRKDNPHYQFSKDLVKTWASFASLKNVAETSLRGEKFPILDPKGEVRVIEINDVPRAKRLPIEDRMRFWDSLYP